jgi:hypothetical protein
MTLAIWEQGTDTVAAKCLLWIHISNAATIYAQVTEIVQRDGTHRGDALRLVALFSLRFESQPNSGARALLAALRKRGWEEEARLAQVPLSLHV